MLLNIFEAIPCQCDDELKNAYELLNLRALKISMLDKSHIFQCEGTFEIPHKISYPYNERCGLYSQVKL